MPPVTQEADLRNDGSSLILDYQDIVVNLENTGGTRLYLRAAYYADGDKNFRFSGADAGSGSFDNSGIFVAPPTEVDLHDWAGPAVLDITAELVTATGTYKFNITDNIGDWADVKVTIQKL